MPTRIEARDDMFGLITERNNSYVGDIGYLPQIIYQNVSEPNNPGESFWMRVSIMTGLDEQATLSTCEGTPGSHKYSIDGVIALQLFLPKSIANAADVGDRWADWLRNGFRGASTPNGVWFRNATIKEAPEESLYYRLNITAEFQYSEIY